MLSLALCLYVDAAVMYLGHYCLKDETLTSASSCNRLADNVQRAGAACTSAHSTEMVTKRCRIKHIWRINMETNILYIRLVLTEIF